MKGECQCQCREGECVWPNCKAYAPPERMRRLAANPLRRSISEASYIGLIVAATLFIARALSPPAPPPVAVEVCPSDEGAPMTIQPEGHVKT